MELFLASFLYFGLQFTLKNLRTNLLMISTRSPISLYWTISLTRQSTCLSERDHLLAAGIINTISDLLVVILPIPTVLGVNVSRRETVVILLLFGAGFTATAAGAARTYFVYRITTSNDKTWDIYLFWISASVEIYLGIICASVPATRKFFSRYLPKLLRSNPQSSIPAPVSSSRSPRSGSLEVPKEPWNDTDTIGEIKMEGNSSNSREEDFSHQKNKFGSSGSNIFVETKISISTEDNRAETSWSEQTYGEAESHDELVLVPK
jgi:hypothetical protein